MNLRNFGPGRTKVALAAVLAGIAGSGSAALVASAADAPNGPVLSVPRAVAFDNVAPGAFADRTISVSSTGTQGVAITGTSHGGLNPGDFKVAASTCDGTTLAPGQTCTITERFQPTTVGTRLATLRIDTANACTAYISVGGGGSTAAPAGAASPRQAVSNCSVIATTTTVTSPGSTVTTPGTTTTTSSGSSNSTSAPGSSTTSTQSVAGSNAVSLTSAKKCVSRRAFTITVRPKRALRGVTVKLGTKTVRSLKTARKSFRARIVLNGLPRRRYTVRVTGTYANGKKFTQTRNYVTCVAKR